MLAHQRRLSEVNCGAHAEAWITTHELVSESIVVVKLVHTAIFLVLLGCVLHVTWAGLRGRATRPTGMALVAIAVETIVFMLNNRGCPLTIIIEDLGAEHGQVSDIFLPGWIAQRIFTISTSPLSLSAVVFAVHYANWPRAVGLMRRRSCQRSTNA